MGSYQRPYLALFNALTDILEELERQNYGLAMDKIIEAQRKAEDYYLMYEETHKNYKKDDE